MYLTKSDRPTLRSTAPSLNYLDQMLTSESESESEVILNKNFDINKCNYKLNTKKTPYLGLGLFTFSSIKKGQFIIEYKGEKLNHQQYEDRLNNILNNNSNSYLFKLNKDLYIDGNNMARYINHSCRPNCRAKIMNINGEKKVIIFASKNIEPDINNGVELFYDYGSNYFTEGKCNDSNCKYNFKKTQALDYDQEQNSNINKFKYIESNICNKKNKKTGSPEFIQDLLNKRKFDELKKVDKLNASKLKLEFIIKNGFDRPILVNQEEKELQIKLPKEFNLNVLEKNLGADYEIIVIDVQKQIPSTMKLSKLIKEFEKDHEDRDKVLNCLALELSSTELSSQILEPEFSRYLNFVDNGLAVFKENNLKPIQVSKYMIVSMKGSYTDFHIDFSGSSTWFHVYKGSKIFYFIEPTEKNIKVYEEWLSKENNSEIFLPDEIEDECYFYKLKQGDTVFLPAGWIHSVYTPDDSICFSGSFLHIFNADLQIKVFELEGRLKTEKKFMFPHFKFSHLAAAEFVYELLRNLFIENELNYNLCKSDKIRKKIYDNFKIYHDFTLKYLNAKGTKILNRSKYVNILDSMVKLLGQIDPCDCNNEAQIEMEIDDTLVTAASIQSNSNFNVITNDASLELDPELNLLADVALLESNRLPIAELPSLKDSINDQSNAELPNEESSDEELDFSKEHLIVYGIKFTRQGHGDRFARFSCPNSKKRGNKKFCGAYLDFLCKTNLINREYKVNKIYDLIIGFKLHLNSCIHNDQNELIKEKFRDGLVGLNLFNEIKDEYQRQDLLRTAMKIDCRELLRHANINVRRLNVLGYIENNNDIYLIRDIV